MRINMLGTTPYTGRNEKTYLVPTWKDLGFLTCPIQQPATGAERLFRVWSSYDKETGRFFSLTAYRTRSEAERHSNVMQFGNGVLHQTQFSVRPGTPLWIGKAHPGEFAEHFGHVAGSQVFVDFDYLRTSIVKVRDLPMLDDMNGAFVVDNPDRGQLNDYPS